MASISRRSVAAADGDGRHCPAAETPKPAELKPGEPVDYGKLAFYPERWEKHKLSTQLVPWDGQHVVLLTTTLLITIRAVMTQFLSLGWMVGGSCTPI